MKKIIALLITVSFLLQSCYSYKTIDKNKTSKKIGNIYKIKSNIKQFKGKLISYNDSLATLKVGIREMKFKISEIEILKERKISVAKTIILSTTLTVVGIIGGFVLTYDGPKMGPINSPN